MSQALEWQPTIRFFCAFEIVSEGGWRVDFISSTRDTNGSCDAAYFEWENVCVYRFFPASWYTPDFRACMFPERCCRFQKRLQLGKVKLSYLKNSLEGFLARPEVR